MKPYFQDYINSSHISTRVVVMNLGKTRLKVLNKQKYFSR
jgi:hypothetical protein